MEENGGKTKYEGKPIGKWLNEQDCDPSSQKAVVGNSEFSPPSTALQGVKCRKRRQGAS